MQVKIPKKPETIADLSINWNFNQIKYRYFTDFYLVFKDKNPNLKSYNIIPNIYAFEGHSCFPYNDGSDFLFWVKINQNDTIANLMYFIHNEVAFFLKRDYVKNFTLGKFVKNAANSFEILDSF